MRWELTYPTGFSPVPFAVVGEAIRLEGPCKKTLYIYSGESGDVALIHSMNAQEAEGQLRGLSWVLAHWNVHYAMYNMPRTIWYLK